MKKTMGMGKRVMIAAAIAMAWVASTGCDVDADFGSPVVVDNIDIAPDDWKIMLDGGRFDYYYYDVDLHMLNEGVFINGNFNTYWRYGEGIGVQEPLPAVMHLSRYSEGRWVEYTETLSCSYEVGMVRIMLSRSDFFTNRPGDVFFQHFHIFQHFHMRR